MSGQSWSRREAPWGARAVYSCSHRSGAAISGPGMQIGKRKPKKVSAANLLAERAALAGFTEVDTFTSAQQASAAHRPSSTRERAQREQDGSDVATSAAVPGLEEDTDEDFGWFYEDESQDVQGPYGLKQMRSWYQAGYLKNETRVRPWNSKEYRPLRAYAAELKIESQATKQAGDALPSKSTAAPRKVDLMNKGPTGGDGAVLPGTWTMIEEGVGAFKKPIWWNVLTDQKIDISIARPDARILAEAVSGATQRARGVTSPASGTKPGAMLGLEGYASSSDSDG